MKLSERKIFDGPSGSVLHALRSSDESFVGFGEAYFSTVKRGSIKGWKRHHKMTLNLFVPVGEVRFVTFDDRSVNKENHEVLSFCLSRKNYYCLTVPPLVWFAFQGLAESENLVMNVANIMHDPSEVEQRDLSDIPFEWE